MSFAVCSAVDCQPETEKVLNATIAVSNNHFAVSKNMNSGSVRGPVLKSTPIQPKDPTDEEVAWNVSVETALSAGGGSPSLFTLCRRSLFAGVFFVTPSLFRKA